MAFFYILGCIVVETFFGNFNKRKLMITGGLCMTLVSTMIGPSKFLNYPENMWLMIGGLSATGFTLAFSFVPSCPEMVETAQLQTQSQNPKINDITSGIFNLAVGLGALIGP